jgi:hypothetical protein
MPGGGPDGFKSLKRELILTTAVLVIGAVVFAVVFAVMLVSTRG